MKKIGIFYSFNTKNTSKIAKQIAKAFDAEIAEENVEEMTEDTFLEYDNLILGVPTWFDGELPNYWDEFVPAIEDMDLSGKKIAIFGLGDQKGYPQNFVDAIGILAEILETQGAEIVGKTSVDGYDFESSKALRDGKFLGLALDLENQADKNDERIKNWINDLTKSF